MQPGWVSVCSAMTPPDQRTIVREPETKPTEEVTSEGYVTPPSSINVVPQRKMRGNATVTSSEDMYSATEFLSVGVSQSGHKLKVYILFVVLFTAAVLIGLATLFPYMLASTSVNWKSSHNSSTTTYSLETLRDLGMNKGHDLAGTESSVKNTRRPFRDAPTNSETKPNEGNSSNECAKIPCLHEARYLRVQPKGFLSFQVEPCNDFYGFVCTEDMLNLSHPDALPYRYISVNHVYRAAIQHTHDMLGMIDNVDTALSQVMLFIKNCTSVQDRLVSQKDAFLDVLSMVDLEAFPYLINEKLTSPMLDEAYGATVRFLDVAPFFRVKIVDNTRGFGNIVLLTSATEDAASIVGQLSLHVDNLLTTWWKLRDLLPVLYSQPDRDIEAMLNIFREVARLSAQHATSSTSIVRLKDLPAGNHWDWQRTLNAIFANVTTFTDYSPVLVDSPDYFNDLAQLIDQYQVRHLLNYLGLCIASQYRLFFSDRYSSDASLPGASYLNNVTTRREQLCLRHAERVCPAGVDALLLQSFAAGSFTRKELIEELNWWIPMFKAAVLEVVPKLQWLNMKQMLQLQDLIVAMKVDLAFWDGSRLQSEDLSSVRCDYDRSLYQKHPLLHFVSASQPRLRRYFNSLTSEVPSSRSPRGSSFDYDIVYRGEQRTIFVPMSYFGQILRSPPGHRKLYVVKLLPDLIRAVISVMLANTSDAHSGGHFSKIKECVASSYKGHALHFRYETFLHGPVDFFRDLLSDHLAIEPYIKLFMQISKSRNFLSGFEPYNNYHVAFLLYAESDCRRYTPSFNRHQQDTFHLSPMSRLNGALSRWLPFGAQFQCPEDSPMRKDACPWHHRGNTPLPIATLTNPIYNNH
ncbi:uncharacterized protein LOC135401612 [Ornithodoros turicata]|uniref:uncharacterized protein LOC135401612 n=1 Tax=Ornithodoros turicata TaxID=34597 RepID=UPI003138C834